MTGKGWMDKTKFKQFLGELGVRTADDFERYAMHFLRLLWPTVIGTPRRKKVDSKGVDHIVWSEKPPFPVIVQCKGWEVLEDQLGQKQINQCLNSIDSFKKSGFKAKEYILVHNRIGKDKSFREPIENELRILEVLGQVKKAKLWSAQKLLQVVFNTFQERCLAEIKRSNINNFRIFQDLERIRWEPLDKVPLQTSVLLVEPTRLVSSKQSPPRVSDPCNELLSKGQSIAILIGQAGFGKSTTAFRLATLFSSKTIYVPAAMITEKTANVATFLKQAINLEELLEDSLPEDRPIHAEIAYTVLANVLKKEDTKMLLIIDALDESIYFNRGGGIQELINIVKGIEMPTVLTARSEYWQERKTDFETGYWIKSSKAKRRKIRFVELLEWSDDKILELISQVEAQLKDASQLARVRKLKGLIESGKYVDFYGDIPKRPIFLRFILETVLQHEPHQVNKAQLFYEWACDKIRRDISNPKQFGGQRIPIASREEVASTTIELAFLAMTKAAALMTNIVDDEVQMTPSCTVNQLRASHASLKRIKEPVGLLLNSLLIPTRTSLGEEKRICFSHRAFQEYFLARAIYKGYVNFNNAKIPNQIVEWIDALQTDS
jgi:hypothetical protein